MKNDGYDNEESDYILYVNDILGSEEAGHKYVMERGSVLAREKILLTRPQEPLPHPRRPRSRHFRSGGQVPELEDAGSRRRQSHQESHGILQPEHDGGVSFGPGE